MKEARRLASLWIRNGISSTRNSQTPVYKVFKGGRWITTATQTEATVSELKKCPVKPYEEIPKIPTLPLIGVAWAYMPFIGKYTMNELNLSYGLKYKEYGRIVREEFSKAIRSVNLFDVEDFEKYFRREGKDAERILFESIRSYRKARPDRFLGGGLAASNGSEWYNLRSKVQPHLLRHREIHNYLPGVDSIAKDFVAQVALLRNEKKEVAHFRKELMRWGIESVGYIGLDTRLGALDNNDDAMALLKAGDELFALFHKLEFGFSFLWRLVPTPSYRRLVKTMDFFSDLAMKHIQAAAKRLEQRQHDDDNPKTLLETFLVQENMDPRLANTMIMDMLLAGVDTTSSTTSFLLYHLAKNPDIQEKAYQEIKRVMASGNGDITTETLNEIRYVKSCLKESMRVTPTVSGFPRTLKEDTVVAGYNVPSGAMLFFGTSVACKLESNFKNASEYCPERWMEKKDYNPFAFMPFGFGVRSCIGRRIAEMEMQTLIIRILEKFRVEYHYEDLECVTKLVNLPKRPLNFRFIER